MFTVDVEEYFQVEAFSGIIPKEVWDKYPTRVDGATTRLLELMDTFRVTGTFFILGCLARKQPALVDRIFKAGHEVASHGYDHTMITKMTPEAFRQDIRKSKAILEDITGRTVTGYRAPTFSITERTSWAYDILLEENHTYSSSVYPVWHDRYGWPSFGDHPRRMVSFGDRELWEIPLSVWSIGRFRIPFGGGGYLRAYPLRLTEALFRRLERKGRPGVVYVHPWELDTRQPEIRASFLTRFRHNVGIARTERKLTRLLQTRRFGTMARMLEERIGLSWPPQRAGVSVPKK